MRRLVVLALATIVPACGNSSTGGGSDGAMPPTGTIMASVTHYDYTLDLDSRAAHATVALSVDTAGNCIELPLRAASITKSSIKLDGVAAGTGTSVGSDSLIACGSGYAAGTSLTLDADLKIALATLAPSQVGYSTEQDAQRNDYYYLVSWVNGCDQFAPCDNRPDQFATYTFTITHKAGYIVRCPGTIDDSDPTTTKCDFEYPGGPTYSTFGVIASNAWGSAGSAAQDLGMWGGVHVTLYDRAATDIAGAIDTTYHDGFVTWMEGEFGAYPYGTDLRVLTAPTYWNGFEHPGNIVLADSLAKQVDSYADVVAHTIDHEMTHMWAGDQTTLAGTYDFAWKESMAEYMAFVWEDMNDASISATTASVWKADSSVVTHYPVPQDQPDLFSYYSDVYGPGPFVFFRQLEVLSSRAQVIAALQSVLGSPHSLSVDDLVAALAQSTGLDLDAYAAGWIKGTGTPLWPKIAASYDATSGMLHVTSSNPAMGCAFHVALVSADGSQTLSVAVDTFHNGADQMIAAAPAFAVASYTIDPDHECLVYPADAVPAVRSRRPWVAPR
jgi:aminopeptidase N